MKKNLTQPNTTTSSWMGPTYDPHETLDHIDGHVCPGCRLIWVGGYRPEELDEPTVGESISPSAEAFVESLKMLSVTDEPDHGHGYADCLVCDETIIDGHQAQAFIKP